MLLEMNILPGPVRAWLNQWLINERLATPSGLRLLAGDGSTRKFYRLSISPSASDNPKSYILLVDPDWISSKDYPVHQAYLAERHLPVPKFIAVNPAVGALLMEDAGDVYLQHCLTQKSVSSNSLPLWEAATELIAHFHGKTYPIPADLPGSQRRFDTQKFLDELKFTEQHLVIQYLKLPSFPSETWRKIEAFCNELDHLKPWVLCHRDYHTRNLMVHGERLVLIDFQDARLGPPHYDLASLLWDSYAPLSEKERTHLQKLYLKTLSSYPLYQKIQVEKFSEDLRAVAFQRIVKAAGSFASFFNRFGKDTHLPYLIPSLKSAVALQREEPRLAEVGKLMGISTWLDHVQKKATS